MTKTKTKKTDVVDIPIANILFQNDWNVRGNFAPFECVDLARDIRDNGLMFPIIVVPHQCLDPLIKYKCIAGFRRGMAHILNKATTIACTIKEDLTDEQQILINIRENTQRKSLTMLQEAKGVEKLMALGLPEKEIAKKLSETIHWVKVREDILLLPEEVQPLCGDLITSDQIRRLAKMRTNEEIFEAVKKLKEANERGDKKIDLKPVKPVNINKPKRPTDAEINGILELFMSEFDDAGMGIHTICLAWAVGNISLNQLFEGIKEFADSLKMPFTLTARQWIDNLNKI